MRLRESRFADGGSSAAVTERRIMDEGGHHFLLLGAPKFLSPAGSTGSADETGVKTVYL